MPLLFRTLQGLPYMAGKPLSAVPASSQASSQPFSHMAFQFLRKDIKPFSTSEPLYLLISLPGMLFTCNSVDRLLSSFRSRSNFHFLWEFFPDSYFKLCPWLYFLILTEISFQVYIPICNYIFVDDKRNHVSFVHHSIPRV